MISIALNIIIIVICMILILLLGLLFIPFHYKFDGYVNEKIYVNGVVKWIFCFEVFYLYKEKEDSHFKVKLSLFGLNKFSKNNSKKKNKIEKFRKRIQITKKLISVCYEYFKDIINIIKPKYINISGVYGFFDPSITGIICGIISIINCAIPYSFINVEPDFEEEKCDIEVNVSGRIVLCTILFRTLKFILNKEVRKNFFKKRKKCETLKSLDV
ncbi:MAG: DUF2953 domain-containing protein [Clostridium butyricum]|nr:DUF2953 domain-containing protein [Clostridium butyricum]